MNFAKAFGNTPNRRGDRARNTPHPVNTLSQRTTNEKHFGMCFTANSSFAGKFVAQAVCADSQAFGDLKIHIASVRRVLVDSKLADPQKRLQ